MLAKIRINSLLDFYGNLLTEKQKAIAEYYFREDLSLQEIAEIESISRSAVYDTVQRCKKDLENFENRLHMVESFEKRSKIYTELLNTVDDPAIRKLINRCIDTETEGGQNE